MGFMHTPHIAATEFDCFPSTSLVMPGRVIEGAGFIASDVSRRTIHVPEQSGDPIKNIGIQIQAVFLRKKMAIIAEAVPANDLLPVRLAYGEHKLLGKAAKERFQLHEIDSESQRAYEHPASDASKQRENAAWLVARLLSPEDVPTEVLVIADGLDAKIDQARQAAH